VAPAVARDPVRDREADREREDGRRCGEVQRLANGRQERRLEGLLVVLERERVEVQLVQLIARRQADDEDERERDDEEQEEPGDARQQQGALAKRPQPPAR
jgi:hypothetical protein